LESDGTDNGLRRVAAGAVHLSEHVDGHPVDVSAIVSAAFDQLQLTLFVLRVAGRDEVEIELLSGTLSESIDTAHACRSILATTERRPWEQPGWLLQTTGELDIALGSIGRERIGPPLQVQHWELGCVLKIPTKGSVVWCKATPNGLAREGELIRWLRQVDTAVVPDVLHLSHGWFVAEDVCSTPPVRTAPDPLTVLARLQLACLGCEDDLGALGCPDRGPVALCEELQTLAAGDGVLIESDRRRLQRVLPTALRSLERVAATNLPATIVHGDLHSANLFWSDRGWVLIDWADATIGHPFSDLAPALLAESPSARLRRTSSYAACWGDVSSSADLDVGLRCAPVLGAAHQLVLYAYHAGALPRAPSHAWLRAIGDWLDQLVLAC
jgi:hypothetical protein